MAVRVDITNTLVWLVVGGQFVDERQLSSWCFSAHARQAAQGVAMR